MFENEANIQISPHFPYLLVNKNRVWDISYAFTDLTGYGKCEILHMTLQEVFKKVFRSNTPTNISAGISTDTLGTTGTQADIQAAILGTPVAAPSGDFARAKHTGEFFLFTKNNETRIINIFVLNGIFPDEYYYIFIEKPGSRLDDKLTCVEQLFLSNSMGLAIYGVPGFILLKASQSYLNSFDEPYNNAQYSIGQRIDEILNGWKGSKLETLWHRAFESGEIVHQKELEFHGLKRGITYWNVLLIPIFEGSSIKYIIDSSSEITDAVLSRIDMQKYIVSLDKKNKAIETAMQTRDDFFSFITHEFKTPLTVIYAAVQAMEHICQSDMSQKAVNFVKQIKRNTLRMLRLINNLLDITRFEKGYMKIHKRNRDIVEATKTITESVLAYATEKGVELKFMPFIAKEEIALDEEKYERIMLNLLSNAIKFTPAGKSVMVKVSSKRHKVCIEVVDEGIGIPKERQDKIFSRFSHMDITLARKTEGTGLGLFLTKLLVEALEGEITVTSEVGKGSTFTVLLPAAKLENEEVNEPDVQSLDNRFIQAVAIEFSDVCLHD